MLISRRSIVTLRSLVGVIAATVLLSSCGWQLRGYQAKQDADTKAAFSEMDIVSENRSNAFFRNFQTVLKKQNITLNNESELRLHLSGESIRRQPLTYNRSGVPAQYQLTLNLEFFVTQGNQVIVEKRNLIARRNYDFDPDLIIAKDREEQELLTEMRTEVSRRILSSIHQAQ